MFTKSSVALTRNNSWSSIGVEDINIIFSALSRAVKSAVKFKPFVSLVCIAGFALATMDAAMGQHDGDASDLLRVEAIPSQDVSDNSLAFLKNIPLYPSQINGLKPSKVAINDVKNLVYVVNQESNSISVINGATNAVIKSIAVEKDPRSIAIDTLSNKI